MKIELKPCPFCGAEAEVFRKPMGHIPSIFQAIRCTGCGVETNPRTCTLELVGLWESRHPFIPESLDDGVEFFLGHNELPVGEFVDRSGQKCSIQESSMTSEKCIWLGVGLKERMLLNQGLAVALIPFLQAFAYTGQLPAMEIEVKKA